MLARTYGTPFKVYDGNSMRADYRRLTASVEGLADVHYSVKSNPYSGLAAILVEEGAGLVIASMGELKVAIDVGFPPFPVLVFDVNHT